MFIDWTGCARRKEKGKFLGTVDTIRSSGILRGVEGKIASLKSVVLARLRSVRSGETLSRNKGANLMEGSRCAKDDGVRLLLRSGWECSLCKKPKLRVSVTRCDADKKRALVVLL